MDIHAKMVLMLKDISALTQTLQHTITIHLKEIPIHTLVNKGIAKMNTLHHQITAIHTVIAIIDNMVMETMETIGKFIMRPSKLALIILLMASFNVNAGTIEDQNARNRQADALNRQLNEQQANPGLAQSNRLQAIDDAYAARQNAKKALELQQQEQQLRIQELQLRIQEQQRYMNQ